MSVSFIHPNLWLLTRAASAQSSSPSSQSSQGSFDLASVLTGGGASSTNSGTVTATTPDQKLATDLTALMTGPRSAAPGGTQTANADPTEGTRQARPHHHHHHHEGGGEAGAATGVAANLSGTTGAARASNGQTGARALATDMMRALRAYVGTGSSMRG
jgi:hypothetical protein